MGWFGSNKKVVPRVPFPQGKPIDDKSLRFSMPSTGDRVIEPEQIKQAVGYSKLYTFPEEVQLPSSMASTSSLMPQTVPTGERVVTQVGPMFTKVEVYSHVLEEVDALKATLGGLQETSRMLEKSEYNEEHHFEQLRRSIRGVHDRLLQMDKKLFKSQGD